MNIIPQNRVLLYLFIVGAIPLVIVLSNYSSKCSAVAFASRRLSIVSSETLAHEKRQATNTIVSSTYRNADHFYLYKNLENMVFLEEEIVALEKIVASETIADTHLAKKRLDFLTGPNNQLIFREGAVKATGTLKETVETLAHPVEINITDLQKILAKIEGVTIDSHRPGPNRPQLIITDISLEKKKTYEHNEIFTMNVKLLKREYL